MELFSNILPICIIALAAVFAFLRFRKEQRYNVFHEFRLFVLKHTAGLISEVTRYIDSMNSDEKPTLDWAKVYEHKYQVAMRLLPRLRSPDLDRELLVAMNNLITSLKSSAPIPDLQDALENIEKRARMLSLYVWYARSYGRKKSNPFRKNYKGDKFLLSLATTGNENSILDVKGSVDKYVKA